MTVEVAATVAALRGLSDRLDGAARDAVGDIARAVQASSMRFAPVLTGTLRRSIDVQGPFPAGPHTWGARVGPTVIYGRIAELGGHIYPRRARALRWWAADGTPIFAMHVYHPAHPYMKPGLEAVRPTIDAIVAARVAAVLGGA